MDKEFLNDFIKKMQADGGLYEKFHRALLAGKNEVFHNIVSEAITLDDSWILTVDAALFSVEKIVKNPRKFIIDEDLIVDVAKARKTTAKTVRHLSSHSQFVQNVADDGEVRPKKVLTTEMDEDIAIYENRFVCTLINRLIPFVEQRYRDILSKMNTFDVTGVGIKSNFKYYKNDIECEIKVKIVEPPHDVVLLAKNKELIERITQIRRRLKVLQSTSFMVELSKKKPVRPPIMKTNLIRMNVDYQNCYKLWLYISSYTFVGYSVDYREKQLPVDGDYYDDLTVLAGLSIQSLFTNNLLNKYAYEAMPFQPLKRKDYKVITSYVFDPLFDNDRKEVGEEVVNEYYFRQMKDEIVKATRATSTITHTKDLRLSFERFFKAVAKINNEMFDDLIDTQKGKKKELTHKTALQKKQQAVKDQQLVLRRYRQLSRLRREELEKQLNAESRELLKLEKLQAELDKEKGKIEDKKALERKRKERLAKIQKKKELAEANAQAYEGELREQDAARLAAIEQEKAKKREEAKRRRELKKLEELKEKYDGDDGNE